MKAHSNRNTASVSELKAKLSAYLDVVRQGNEVLVTDRGRPIARLLPVTGRKLEEGRRELLLRTVGCGARAAPLEWSGTLPDGGFVTFDDRLREAAQREGFSTA